MEHLANKSIFFCKILHLLVYDFYILYVVFFFYIYVILFSLVKFFTKNLFTSTSKVFF